MGDKKHANDINLKIIENQFVLTFYALYFNITSYEKGKNIDF